MKHTVLRLSTKDNISSLGLSCYGQSVDANAFSERKSQLFFSAMSFYALFFVPICLHPLTFLVFQLDFLDQTCIISFSPSKVVIWCDFAQFCWRYALGCLGVVS